MRRRRKVTKTELDEHLVDDLGALSASARNKIMLGKFKATHSIDLDRLYRDDESNSYRWDYFIWAVRGSHSSELYLEVHEVSDDHFDRIVKKSEWLAGKIAAGGWPQTDGRPFLVAPTAGIPTALFGDLSRRLALKKIMVVMKGHDISKLV